MKKYLNFCVGCSLYDPDYGCLAEHEWDCPQSDVAPPYDEEVSGDA